MSPQMRKRIFDVEERLIRRIDEEKEKQTGAVIVPVSFSVRLEKSHSVYYV